MKAVITVMPKAAVVDPQGEAVRQAIAHLGLEGIRLARVGKSIELDIEAADSPQVRGKLEEICRDLLSNPVIEDYSVRIEAA